MYIDMKIKVLAVLSLVLFVLTVCSENLSFASALIVPVIFFFLGYCGKANYKAHQVLMHPFILVITWFIAAIAYDGFVCGLLSVLCGICTYHTCFYMKTAEMRAAKKQEPVKAPKSLVQDVPEAIPPTSYPYGYTPRYSKSGKPLPMRYSDLRRLMSLQRLSGEQSDNHRKNQNNQQKKGKRSTKQNNKRHNRQESRDTHKKIVIVQHHHHRRRKHHDPLLFPELWK